MAEGGAGGKEAGHAHLSSASAAAQGGAEPKASGGAPSSAAAAAWAALGATTVSTRSCLRAGHARGRAVGKLKAGDSWLGCSA